jgi:hypothetical protein
VFLAWVPEAFESGEVVEEEFDGCAGWTFHHEATNSTKNRQGVLGREDGGEYCPG